MGTTTSNPLTEIDEVIEEYEVRQAEEVADQNRSRVEREAFVHLAGATIDKVIRPAMQEATERLRSDGAGGRIVEDPADSLHPRRLTMWMSLDGPVEGAPRQDLNPYLQLSVDVPTRCVDVREGDMWHQRGTGRAVEREDSL